MPTLQQTLLAIIREILATGYADRLAPIVSMGMIIHVQHPSDVERWDDEERPCLTFTAFHGGIMDVSYTSDGEDAKVDLRGIPASIGAPKVMECLARIADETGA